MHDPFQTYSMLGAYPGTTGALGLIPPTHNPFAGGISPFAQQSGFGQQSGFPGYGGLIPQQWGQQIPYLLPHIPQQHLHQQLQQQALYHQLQLAALLGGQGLNPQLQGLSPFATGWNNPLAVMGQLQNPLVSQILQNPLLNPILAQQYQNPLLNPILAQQYQQPYGQIGGGLPFGQQMGTPFGQSSYPLPPQSWIGQGQQGFGGSPFGQGNPLLSQLGGRGVQGHGISPWAGF